MKKSLSIIKYIALTVLIAGLFLWTFCRLTYVFRQKEYTNVQDNFANLPKDSVDTIFIGTSHQFCSVDTNLLYEEYGINSFMLATSAQTVPMSYYACLEAIELQHPKTIVLELAYLANDFRTVTDEMSHTFFDGMPNCEARKLAIEDLIEPGKQVYYYLNLGAFHERWKELTEEDYKSNLTSPRGNHHYENTQYNWNIPVIEQTETEAPSEEMLKYLDKIIALCRENRIELITYVAPFNSLYNDEDTRTELFRMQRVFNWCGEYLNNPNIRFYNLFYELPEIGLDGNTDFMDSQHTNYLGQAKITRYMAEHGYLQ